VIEKFLSRSNTDIGEDERFLEFIPRLGIDLRATCDRTHSARQRSTGFSESIAETRTFSNLFDDRFLDNLVFGDFDNFDDNVIDRNMGRKISSDLGFDKCRTLNLFRRDNTVVGQGAAL
jgi:hypothetical protein